MKDRKPVNDYDNKNKDFEDNCNEVKDEGENKVDTDGCISNIIIKPIVDITANIEGLEAIMFVTDSNEETIAKNLEDDKDNEGNELEEDLEAHESVNCIIIKPIVKMDINISGLNTLVNQ